MIAFILELPQLSEEQQLQLEEVLLKIPKVDAFAMDDDTGNFSIAAEADNKVMRDLVAALYGWGSEYPGILMHMKAVCSEEKAFVLGKHSPNDIIHFLSSC